MEGIILSSWDYIMGPQIERLWLINHQPSLKVTEVPVHLLRDFNICKNHKQNEITNDLNCHCNLKTYSFMCGQLLLNEMDVVETLAENTSRTYISDFKILISLLFRMKTWIYAGTVKEVKNVSLCLGMIYQQNAFNFILQNQFALDIHLRNLADVIQNTKPPYDSVLCELSDTVMDLAPLLNMLHQNILDHIQSYMYSSILDYSVSSILTEAIVSHLQTSGRTVVLGGSDFKIKQIINILSLFSNKEELCSSLPINCWPYKSKVTSLYIQGIIKKSEKDCEYFLEKAYDESQSLTVIDTDLCRVWQTYPFHESVEKSRVFSLVTDTGDFVPQLLKDLSFAYKNGSDTHTIIENFSKLLMMKAVAIVKVILHFKNVRRILSKKELMNLFAIKMFVDLQIVLGCAEKIKPGIRSSIL